MLMCGTPKMVANTLSSSGQKIHPKNTDTGIVGKILSKDNSLDSTLFCRYAVIPGKKAEESVLITSHIPISRSGRPLPCFLTKWADPKYAPLKIVNAGTEPLSALAIRY